MHAQRCGRQPGRTAGQVEHALFRATADEPGVEQQQVGGVAFADQTAALQTEHLRRMRGQAPHRLAHAHHGALACPVPEQVQAEAGVVEEGQVRARITQGNDAVRMGEQPAHCLFFAVEQLRGEHRLQVFGKRQVEHHVERVATFPVRDLGNALLLVVRMFRACHFDHVHLLPLAVEQAKRRRRGEFNAQRIAKLASRQHL